jgi:hypothetical protein
MRLRTRFAAMEARKLLAVVLLSAAAVAGRKT